VRPGSGLQKSARATASRAAPVSGFAYRESPLALRFTKLSSQLFCKTKNVGLPATVYLYRKAKRYSTARRVMVSSGAPVRVPGHTHRCFDGTGTRTIDVVTSVCDTTTSDAMSLLRAPHTLC
jgi:hypothetical protein